MSRRYPPGLGLCTRTPGNFRIRAWRLCGDASGRRRRQRYTIVHMFDLMLEAGLSCYVQWLATWPASTWSIKTSESDEVDIILVAAGKGCFYAEDSSNPYKELHQIRYAGLGLTKSAGPINFKYGGSFSTTDMPGGGLGKVHMKPSKSELSLNDFDGTGCIISGSITIPTMPSASSVPTRPSDPTDAVGASIVFFGAPPLLTVAIAMTWGRQKSAPGVAALWMPCIFLTRVGEPGTAS